MSPKTQKDMPDLAATQRIFPMLTVFRDNEVIATVTLDKRSITIGRSADNEVCLDEAGVSRQHAQVVTILGESVVEDLNSRNGTFVNGKWIKTRQLAPGDAIIIAGFRLVYQHVPDEQGDELGDLMRRWGRGFDPDLEGRCAACGQALPTTPAATPAATPADPLNTILL
jgi:FHA domain